MSFFLFEPSATLLSMYLYNFTKLMSKEKLEAHQHTYQALIIQVLKNISYPFKKEF